MRTPPGLAPEHPTSAAVGLSRTLRRASAAIHAAAPELAALSAAKVRTRVRTILRAQLDLEAIAAAGAKLERTTRARFQGAIASLVEAAKARPRGDRKTTISLRVPAGKTKAKLVAAPADEAVEAWASKAAKLVRSVEASAIEGIAADVAAAFEEGLTPAELAARWREQGLPLEGGGRLESSLDLIAQNQLGRLNSELARSRSQAAGLGSYRWVDMGDGRVRPLHRELGAGPPREWDDPHPTEGHPGTAPRCRCHAESVVTDDDLDRLLGLAE